MSNLFLFFSFQVLYFSQVIPYSSRHSSLQVSSNDEMYLNSDLQTETQASILINTFLFFLEIITKTEIKTTIIKTTIRNLIKDFIPLFIP